MFCSFCGNEFADDAKFCPVCDTRAGDSAPADLGALASAQTGQDVLLSGPRYPLGRPSQITDSSLGEGYLPSSPAPSYSAPLYGETPPLPHGGADSPSYSLSSLYDLPAASGDSDTPSAGSYSPPAHVSSPSAGASAAGGYVPPAPPVSPLGESGSTGGHGGSSPIGGGYVPPPPPAASQNPWMIPGMTDSPGAKSPKRRGRRGKVIAVVLGAVALIAVTLVLLYFFLPPSLKIQFTGKSNYYLQLEMKNAQGGGGKLAYAPGSTQSITSLIGREIKSSLISDADIDALSAVDFEGKLQKDPLTGIFNSSYIFRLADQSLEFQFSGDGDRAGFRLPFHSENYYYTTAAAPWDPAFVGKMTGLHDGQLQSLTAKYAARLKALILRDDLMSYNDQDNCRGTPCSSLSLTVDSKTLSAALTVLLTDMKQDDMVIAALINISQVMKGQKAEAIPDDPSLFHLELRQSVVDGLGSLKTQLSGDDFINSFSSFNMKVYFTNDEKIIGREYHITSSGESSLLDASCYLTQQGDIETADVSLVIPDRLEVSSTISTSSDDRAYGALSIILYGDDADHQLSFSADFDFTGRTADRFLPMGSLNMNLSTGDFSCDLILKTDQGPFDSSYETQLKVDAAYPGGDLYLSLDFLTEVSALTQVVPEINDSNALPYDKFQAGGFVSQFSGPTVNL